MKNSRGENPGEKRIQLTLLPGGLQSNRVAPNSKQLNEEDPCLPPRTGFVGKREK